MLRIAVIGAGRWGPNLIRNFGSNERSEVIWVADADQGRLNEVSRRFPRAKLTTVASEALSDDAVDAVVIATPTATHYALAKEALERGRHVLVEKPLCNGSTPARELHALAERGGLVLLVGHVFLFNPAIQWIRHHMQSGELGQIYYISSIRTNLGPIRRDVNAAWDLAAHDISIFNFWLGAGARAVSAQSGNWINPGIDDAAFATFRYPDRVLAHTVVSWLSPRKVRDITVVGEHRMLTYDEMNLNEPIRIYDKGVSEDTSDAAFVDTFSSYRASIREGDITIPPVAIGEPLRHECEHFLDCILDGVRPLCGGPEAVRVVDALEALERSLRDEGREAEIATGI
jgi:predicted dehydrogenase